MSIAPDHSEYRSFDPFRVLDEDERQRHMQNYASHLKVRNGELDLEARILPHREAFFDTLSRSPVAWRGPIDREGFQQRFDGTGMPTIDARTLWLTAIAKANQGEGYGVDLLLHKYLDMGVAPSSPLELHVLLEEHYHTRILVEACRTCGIDIEIMPPPFRTRMLIHAIYHLPERFRWPLILCGEVLGTTVFKLLLECCHLFSEEPEVEDRLTTLISEIWRDEVLHVAFLRAHLGPRGLAVSRAMLPAVARQFMRDISQLSELGCDRNDLMRRIRAGIELPLELAWVEPEAPSS